MEHADDEYEHGVLFGSTTSTVLGGLHQHPQHFENVESTKKMMVDSTTTTKTTTTTKATAATSHPINIKAGETEIFNSHRTKQFNENHHDVHSLVKRYLAVKRVRSTQDLSLSSSSSSSSSSRPSNSKIIRKSTEKSNDAASAAATAGDDSKIKTKRESNHHHLHPHAHEKELCSNQFKEKHDIVHQEKVIGPPPHSTTNKSNSGRVVGDVIYLLDSDSDDECSVPQDRERINRNVDSSRDEMELGNKPTVEHCASVQDVHDFDPNCFNDLNHSLGDDEMSQKNDDDDDDDDHNCGTNDATELLTTSSVANHSTIGNDYLIHNFEDDEISQNIEGDSASIVNKPCANHTAATGSPSQDVCRILSSSEIMQPYRIRYPVGCPVWFNIHYSIPCSKYLLADKGVVRSVFINEVTNTIMYRLETQSMATMSKLKPSGNMISMKEEEIAFAIHCPILMKVEDGTSSEIADGEIINIRPVIENRHGSRKILYTVLLNSKEGDGGVVRVEENVQADRISYRLSLHAIQSRLRHVVESSSNHQGRKLAIGIRSDEHGQPLRNKTPPRQLTLMLPPRKVVSKQNILEIKQCSNAITTCAENNDEDDNIGISSVDDDSSWADERGKSSE